MEMVRRAAPLRYLFQAGYSEDDIEIVDDISEVVDRLPLFVLENPDWAGVLIVQRALAAILGDSAGGVLSHQTILVVFGLWRIDQRRILARASYAFVFSQTRRRPWRASIFAELRARVGRDPVFRKESVTGAIGAALKKLGLAWPRLEVPDGGAARDAPGETAVDSDDEDFVRLLRPRAEIEADARRWAVAAAAEAAAERTGRVILRSGGPLWLILAGGRRETSHSVRGLLERSKGSFRHTITHLQLH